MSKANTMVNGELLRPEPKNVTRSKQKTKTTRSY